MHKLKTWWVAVVMVTLAIAGSASAEYFDMTKLPNNSGAKSVIYETVTASDYLRAEAFGFMRFSFTKGSTFEAVIYGCDTPTYAAATCASLATLSASNDDIPVTTGKSYIIIDVTTAETAGFTTYVGFRGHVTSAGAGGDSVNTLADTNGDGLSDFVLVRGDYNGDGLVSPQDITDAQDDLFASAGGSVAKTVLVEGGLYTMAGETFDWNQTNRGFIELNSYTTLVCRPGTVIEGFAASSDYELISTTKPITNKTDPATNIAVTGCKFSNPAFTVPYDASGYTSQIHYGMHFEGVTNLSVTGNTIEGSNHTCLYVRDSVDAKLYGNSLRYCGGVMEHGGDTTTLNGAVAAKAFTIALQSGDCASWTCAAGDPIMMQLDSGEWHHADVIAVSTDTLTIRPVPPSSASSGNTVFRVETGTAQNGIYLFSQDASTLRADVAYNTIEDVAGVGLHMRSNDNTAIARDLKFRYNNVSRTVADGIDIRGMIGGLIQGNEFNQTQGIQFTDDNTGDVQYCYDDAPNVECSDNVALIGNTWRANRYEAPNVVNGAVRWGRGHSRVKFKGNLVDGTVDGNCMAVFGNSPGSIIEDTTLQNCGGDGFIDGLTAGTAVTTPLVIKNTTIKDVGLSGINDSDANGMRIDLGHTALQFDGLVISGCTDDCIGINGSDATSGLLFRNFSIDATRSGFLGRFTEAQAGTMACDADTDQRWVMTTNAGSTTDCTFASGTLNVENACYCTGGSWTDYGSPTPANKGVESVKNTGAQDDMAFISGVVKNIPNAQEGIRIQGSGAMNRLQVRDVYFSNDGPGRRSTDPIGTALRISSTTVSAAGVSGISCGANVTVCTGTDLDDTEVSGDSFVRSTQTPNGTCVTGAVMIDSDNTGAGTTMYICENSAWNGLD